MSDNGFSITTKEVDMQNRQLRYIIGFVKQ